MVSLLITLRIRRIRSVRSNTTERSSHLVSYRHIFDLKNFVMPTLVLAWPLTLPIESESEFIRAAQVVTT